MRVTCMLPPHRALTASLLAVSLPFTASLLFAVNLLFTASLLLVGAGAAFGATAAAVANAQAPAVGLETHLSHGRFHDFLVYRPAGPPTSFVLLLSGEEGWTSTAVTMARQLVQQGAMVAGIDGAKFKATLEADADQCEFPDGDLENLSHFVQAYFHSPTYLSPVLAGVSSGATLAYAVLAQAPRNTFAAALTLGFCPGLDLEKSLCKGSGLEFTRAARGHGVNFLPIQRLANPWVDLHGDTDRICPADAAQKFISQVHGAAMVT